jgi:[ribosomal protein S18]-alanine N-acetyltransferase
MNRGLEKEGDSGVTSFPPEVTANEGQYEKYLGKRGYIMYKFSPMTNEIAEEIAFDWKYEGKYSFYDMTADEEDLEEFLQPDRKGYYIVERQDEVIGYFCFQCTDTGTVDIGLGMKPQLTGNGQGLAFLLQGMEFAAAEYQAVHFTLSVAAFNERAIKVYERAGFTTIETFMQDTNGSTYEFIKMEYDSKGNENVSIARRI